MSNKTICMLGCHEAGYDTIKYLLENKINISYFIILSPIQGAQYNVSGYFDFQPLALQYNIPMYYPKSYQLKEKEDQKFFSEQKFDLIIQGGWQRLIPENILKSLSIGAIGVHGSSNFLPKGRGRSPLNWSLIDGKKRFIMHLFIMQAGADDGDIFDWDQFDINEFDDIKTLYYKNSIVTKRMLLRNIPKLLHNDIETFKQIGKPTYYPKRSKEDGLIDWKNWDVDKIYNFIRALTKPYPGAFSYIGSNIIYIWKAVIFDRTIKYKNANYGEIVELFDNGDFIVNCLDGLLLITNIDYSKKIKVDNILI